MHAEGCHLVRASSHHLRAFIGLFSMRFVINNHATRARLVLAAGAALVFLSLMFYYLGPEDFCNHSIMDRFMELANEKRSNYSTQDVKEMDFFFD